jgi:plasmid maintenance system antidote protein VapI
MNTYIKLNEEIEDRIYSLRKVGLGRQALAERFGVSPNRITRIVVRAKKRKESKR